LLESGSNANYFRSRALPEETPPHFPRWFRSASHGETTAKERIVSEAALISERGGPS
jgi:hypothetical protein